MANRKTDVLDFAVLGLESAIEGLYEKRAAGWGAWFRRGASNTSRSGPAVSSVGAAASHAAPAVSQAASHAAPAVSQAAPGMLSRATGWAASHPTTTGTVLGLGADGISSLGSPAWRESHPFGTYTAMGAIGGGGIRLTRMGSSLANSTHGLPGTLPVPHSMYGTARAPNPSIFSRLRGGAERTTGRVLQAGLDNANWALPVAGGIYEMGQLADAQDSLHAQGFVEGRRHTLNGMYNPGINQPPGSYAPGPSPVADEQTPTVAQSSPALPSQSSGGPAAGGPVANGSAAPSAPSDPPPQSGSTGNTAVDGWLGNIPNWGKGLGIGAGALGAGLLTDALTGEEEDEFGNKKKHAPWLAPLVGAGALGAGAYWLKGNHDWKDMLTKDFWNKTSSVHVPMILVPKFIKLSDGPMDPPATPQATPPSSLPSLLSLPRAAPTTPPTPVPPAGGGNTMPAPAGGGPPPPAAPASTVQTPAPATPPAGNAAAQPNTMPGVTQFGSAALEFFRQQSQPASAGRSPQDIAGMLGGFTGQPGVGNAAATLSQQSQPAPVQPSAQPQHPVSSIEAGISTFQNPHDAQLMRQVLGRGGMTGESSTTTQPSTTATTGAPIARNLAEHYDDALPGADGSGTGTNIALRSMQLHPEARSPQTGLNNLTNQMRQQHGETPGFMNTVTQIWQALGPQGSDQGVMGTGLSWMQILLGAGLSLGAIGLLGSLTGGGGSMFGGSSGMLLGLGGLATAAYAAGAFDPNSRLRQMLSGASQQHAQQGVAPQGAQQGAPQQGAPQQGVAQNTLNMNEIRQAAATNPGQAINMIAQAAHANPTIMEEMRTFGQYRTYSPALVAYMSNGRLNPNDVTLLQQHWPSIEAALNRPPSSPAAGGPVQTSPQLPTGPGGASPQPRPNQPGVRTMGSVNPQQTTAYATEILNGQHVPGLVGLIQTNPAQASATLVELENRILNRELPLSPSRRTNAHQIVTEARQELVRNQLPRLLHASPEQITTQLAALDPTTIGILANNVSTVLTGHANEIELGVNSITDRPRLTALRDALQNARITRIGASPLAGSNMLAFRSLLLDHTVNEPQIAGLVNRLTPEQLGGLHAISYGNATPPSLHNEYTPANVRGAANLLSGAANSQHSVHNIAESTLGRSIPLFVGEGLNSTEQFLHTPRPNSGPELLNWERRRDQIVGGLMAVNLIPYNRRINGTPISSMSSEQLATSLVPLIRQAIPTYTAAAQQLEAAPHTVGAFNSQHSSSPLGFHFNWLVNPIGQNLQDTAVRREQNLEPSSVTMADSIQSLLARRRALLHQYYGTPQDAPAPAGGAGGDYSQGEQSDVGAGSTGAGGDWGDDSGKDAPAPAGGAGNQAGIPINDSGVLPAPPAAAPDPTQQALITQLVNGPRGPLLAHTRSLRLPQLTTFVANMRHMMEANPELAQRWRPSFNSIDALRASLQHEANNRR